MLSSIENLFSSKKHDSLIIAFPLSKTRPNPHHSPHQCSFIYFFFPTSAVKVHLANREHQERLVSLGIQEHQGHLLTVAVVRVVLEILDGGNNARGYTTIQRMAETMEKCM